jgi:hypothetical protein
VSGARSYCAACGWPLDGLRCSVCGGDRVPLPLQDGARRTPRGSASDDPALEKANEAWQARDFVKVVGAVVAGERSGARPVPRPGGTGFVLGTRSTALFVTVDAASGGLVLEAPLARLPQTRRVPAMRAALELSDRTNGLPRPCLRGDLLLLRHEGSLEALAPARLRALVREMLEVAERWADALVTRFDARPALDEPRGAASWEALGRPRSLSALAPPSRRHAPPAGETPADRTMPPGARRAPDEAPAELARRPRAPSSRAPAPPQPAPWAPRRAHAAADAHAAGDDELPAILAPALVRGLAHAKAPAQEVEPATLPRAPAHRAAMPELELDVAPDEPATARASTPRRRPSTRPGPPGGAADRLCDLLRASQSIATSLSYEHRLDAMLMLVRATVFRAIYDFGEEAPDAVANLYRSTVGAMTDALAPGGPRRVGSVEVTVLEPSLLAMDRLIVLRAQVPKEKPLVVEPMTSVEEARAFLVRYHSDIERAPAEPEVRHFLALGALSEFLVRAKLPGPTEARLREILAHAARDGATPRTVELLMTTLGRIAGK